MNEMQASKTADQLIAGLDYPISKAEILSEARDSNAGPTVLEALQKLPEREYGDAEEVTEALNTSKD
jgi:hypothetical protein